MFWYIKIVIYLFAFAIALFTLYQVDFNKIIRTGRKQFAIFVYVILSIALGYLLGSLFIDIGEAIIAAP